MPHFSALTWRILAFNALALIVLTSGVILVQATGRGMVEERLNSIQEQANIVAGTIAQYATDPDTHTLRVDEAEPLLRQLLAPCRSSACSARASRPHLQPTCRSPLPGWRRRRRRPRYLTCKAS